MYREPVRLPFDPVEEARQNWRRQGWPAADAMAATTAVTRSHQIILSRVDAALAPHGLTFSRFEALALLSFTRHGELPLGKIGERLQVHAASVTNTVNRLEEDGFVERRPHPDDGRTVLARITDLGRKTVAEAAQELGRVSFGLTSEDGDVEAVDVDAIGAALRPLRRNAGDF